MSNNPEGNSPYARKGKKPYDYSHLFKDCPESGRANNRFLWTRELKKGDSDAQ